jgi:hypothetical protein
MPQIHQIDWNVFQRASDNSATNHVQLFKLVHLKLPTNSELAKANPHQSATCQYCPERQTFHHLLKCNNPISVTFRAKLDEAVDLYLYLQEVPTQIAQGLQYVLRLILGIRQDSDYAHLGRTIVQCIDEQLQLGDQFLQGFLSKSWRKTAQQIQQRYGIEQHRTMIDVFAGFVKVMWQEQLELWEKHISKIETSTTGNSIPMSIHNKLEMYKTKVRQLYLLRDKCLPSHRDQYFHSNIEEFLSTATCTQLKQYLHHYEQAIQVSIDAAKQHPARSILTFPGFTRLRSQVPSDPLRTNRPKPTTTALVIPPTVNGGTTLNRKHTRWKHVTNPWRSIRTFFSPAPD